jgi:hypothetical protein
MTEETSQVPYPSRVQRALNEHGEDAQEVYYNDLGFWVWAHAFIILIPFLVLVGLAVGAWYTKGYLACFFMTFSLLFLWMGLLSFYGALHLITDSDIIFLSYKDRMIWIRGRKEEIIYWDEIDYLSVMVNIEKDSPGEYEPPLSAYRWCIGTPQPIACFWRQWLDIHTKDGRVVRVPSSMREYEDVSNVIQWETNALIGPKIRQQIDEGERIPFGPFTALHRDYLEVSEDRMKWTEYSGHWLMIAKFWAERLDGEQLVGDCSVYVTAIPNPGLFLLLIISLEQQYGASASGEESEENPQIPGHDL